MNFVLEACVDSVESAIAAQAGGATRLELCSNLVIGGTTPTPALFRQVREHTTLPIRVLIRPRFGDFCFTDYEHRIQCEEIETFATLGADGVVLGALAPNGELDTPKLREMISCAKGCGVTLHRCFDVCRDPFKAMKQAADLGIDTILTSGQQPSCWEGRKLLKELFHSKPGEIDLMMGAGIQADAIRKLLAEMPARCFHLSGKEILESKMHYRSTDVHMGLPGLDEYCILRTSEASIREAYQVLKEHFQTSNS